MAENPWADLDFAVRDPVEKALMKRGWLLTHAGNHVWRAERLDWCSHPIPSVNVAQAMSPETLLEAVDRLNRIAKHGFDPLDEEKDNE
jgi:hypothetical protein